MTLTELAYLLLSMAMSIFMLLTVIFWEMNFISHCLVAFAIGMMAYQMFTTKPPYVLSGNVYVALFSAPLFIGLIGTFGYVLDDIQRATTIFFGITSYIVGFWSWYIISVFQEEHQREKILHKVVEHTRMVNIRSLGEIAWCVFGPLALLVSAKVEPPTRVEIVEKLYSVGSHMIDSFFGALIALCRLIQSKLPTNDHIQKGQ